jgi:TolA-binding protein
MDAAAEDYRQAIQRFSALTIESEPYRSWQHHFLGTAKRHYGPAARLALGDVLLETKKFDDAELEYRALMRAFPKSDEAPFGAYRTALCYEGREDPENAIKVLKSVLRRYPKTTAGSEAHTRLETRYRIADTEVSDEIDVFTDLETEGKDQRTNFLEDPSKMKYKKDERPRILP